MYDLQIIGNYLVVEKDGERVFRHSHAAVVSKFHESGGNRYVTLDSHSDASVENDFDDLLMPLADITVDGAALGNDATETWLLENTGSFRGAGPSALTTDQANFATADLTTDGPREHTLLHDVVIKTPDNAEGNPTFETEFGQFGSFRLDAHDYEADQETVVSSFRSNHNGGGLEWDFTGQAKLNINNENGLPGDVFISRGGRGDAPVPGYSKQNLVIVDGGQVDFTTAPPTLNFANFETRYWNTTANAQFPVGLYSIVSDFDTLSGFAFREEESDGCVLSMDGDAFLNNAGTLTSLSSAIPVDDDQCLSIVGGPTSNPGQLDAPTIQTAGSFIVQEAGTFEFRHSGQDVVGTAGIGFSRTPFPSTSNATTINQGNLHGSSAAERLTDNKQTEDFTVTFAANESYPLEVYVGFFSGGSSSAQIQRLDRIRSVDVPTTNFTVTTGAAAGGNIILGGSGLEGGVATNTATPAEAGVFSELNFSYFLNNDRIGDGLPVLAEVISAGGIVLGSLEVETDSAAPTIARVPFVPITGDVTIRFTDTATGGDGSNRDLRISDVSLITIGNEKVALRDDGLPDVVEFPEPIVLVDGTAGAHFIDETPIVNIGTTDTPFPTGWDLNRPGRWMIRFIPSDGGGTTRDWASGFLNVDKIVERFNAGDTVDGFAHVFSNAFVTINLINPATGEFVARDQNRDVGIRAELWLVAPTALQRIDVYNEPVAGQDLTASYANYGDPQDELSLVADGDQIEFIYGDGTSANGLFVDGVANVGRQSNLASEAQIVGNQLQVRADSGSTLSNLRRITIFRRSLVTQSPASVVGTNPAARLELTNNTLQSELSLVLGDLGISVDGVAIMPMTSADYTQGGITAVTADSTNWERASTGNGPADTNVGFENVPQGRYRYSFSIPEQEDGSTVAANDVADNDRPFPIILVNGVPAKLHADNTYIEHDDGSTSEYHSSGTIVVPEDGSVQLGLVIEGGNTEEFEFQNAVITTEQGVDAIYGFFEIEKIDRPVVQSATDQPTRTVVNGITIREHADGYIEMSGTDSTGALTLRIITFPNGITMEDANYEAHCNIENASANRFAQISSRTTTTLVLRPHNTASNIIWSVKGYRV